MGQEPGTSGTAVTGSGDPERIQREIEETRRQLGDTVEALAAKTDVKARAKEQLADKRAAVQRNPMPAAAIGAFVAAYLVWRLARH